jgi:hypothetical protein
MFRAVAVLALVVAATASQPPPPAPAKTGQAKQEQARTAQGQTKTDNQPAQKPVPTVQQSNPEITVRYEQRLGNQDKNASAWRDWPAWAVAAFTLGLLIVAVLQWIAMHGQRKLMGEQLAEMKTTSADTHDLATAAKDQIALLATHVDAATKTADAAKQSADTARHALEILECADVLVSKIGQPARFSTDPTERIRATSSAITCAVTVKNHGRTRADYLVVRGQIKSGEFTDDETPVLSKTVKLPMILGAGDTFEVSFPPIYGAARTALFDDKTRSLFVEIVIGYSDILGNSHSIKATGSYWPFLEEFVLLHEGIERND